MSHFGHWTSAACASDMMRPVRRLASSADIRGTSFVRRRCLAWRCHFHLYPSRRCMPSNVLLVSRARHRTYRKAKGQGVRLEALCYTPSFAKRPGQPFWGAELCTKIAPSLGKHFVLKLLKSPLRRLCSTYRTTSLPRTNMRREMLSLPMIVLFVSASHLKPSVFSAALLSVYGPRIQTLSQGSGIACER